MIKRELEQKIKEQCLKFPVVAITGPRQSGKTTLSKELFPQYKYFNLEHLNTKQIVENDPVAFIESFKGAVIIDEIQKVPSLLSQIQVKVDEVKLMGQFILTGSESLLLSEKISQSLAGRVVNNILLPLSFKELQMAGEDIQDLDLQILTGFYPRIYDTEMTFADFYPEYISTYVQRDVRQFLNIGDLSSFERFLQLLAGRVGQLVNLSSLANDVGVSHNTIERWISLLEASYIVFRLRPYHSNIGKRVIKSPKIYFHDTGLLCYLLGINSVNELKNHFAYGNIYENLIISEVNKKIYNNKLPLKIYFYRDSNQIEVDLIIDSGSVLHYCEIKSAKTFNKDFLKSLETISENIGLPAQKFVVYRGDLKQSVNGIKLIGFEDLEELFQGL